MVSLKQAKLGIHLGIFKLEGTWTPDESERNAAWEMYVELVTRVSIVQLKPDEGLLREALASLYSLFESTRRILRSYGPNVAMRKEGSDISFGQLAVAVLNDVLRPVLAKWHPLLMDYENTRQSSVSRVEHERQWEHTAELRQTLEETRLVLIEYADLLADVCGVAPLIAEDDSDKEPQG